MNQHAAHHHHFIFIKVFCTNARTGIPEGNESYDIICSDWEGCEHDL